MLYQHGVVGIGPGLGQDEWSHSMWNIASVADVPLVVDADALNLLARESSKSS